jgi:hypothetical protein
MASIIKADNIQKVSDGSNIIKKCGSTITLGSCGATISLAAGATQTGFGQTYSAVEYCTTAKTSPFTAAAGTGYFINTTCGAVTVTLPASPTAGDVVAFKDYAGQWNTNAVTLCNNGNKINGVCESTDLNTQNQSVSLIYVDATKGWQDIQDSTAGVTGGVFITATGGTITCCGDYKIHTFTSDGTFCVSAGGGPLAVVDYLVVAGGGGAGGWAGGGAGAGGFREGKCTSDPYTASPLDAGSGLSVSVQTYPITVGAGGAGQPYPNRDSTTKGSNSVFSTITSAGGGVGAPNSFFPGHDCGATAGNGGSGGGATAGASPVVGQGNTPPVSPPQGNNGGTGGPGPAGHFGGGGGGAGAVGNNVAGPNDGGPGGAGVTSSITGSPVARAGGGGGGNVATGASTGGTGGGGGSAGPTGGVAGTTNTGGGGGGSYAPTPTGTSAGAGGSGGSGVVVIRYKFQ